MLKNSGALCERVGGFLRVLTCEMFFVDILGKKKVEEMKLQGSIREIEEAKHQHLVQELLVTEQFLVFFMTSSPSPCCTSQNVQ